MKYCWVLMCVKNYGRYTVKLMLLRIWKRKYRESLGGSCFLRKKKVISLKIKGSKITGWD